ncbi:MAG: hypothetical protein ACRDH9_02825 [Actinomycetota bacterium]
MSSLMSATEFGDLAARMSAGLAGVRACLILSRDGLSLGLHPADEEARVRKAWDALQRMGDPRRGFLDMGEEIWVVSARGAYAAIMIASPEAKPGLLLDRMEAELAAAERERGGEGDPLPAEPIDRPHSPLHPEPRLEVKPQPVKAGAKASSTAVVDLSVAEKKSERPMEAAMAETLATPQPQPKKSLLPKRRRRSKPGEINRVALAREFGRLMDDESIEGH